MKEDYQKYSENYQPLILIVDDNRDNLLLASCVVDSLGMRYAVTDNSEKCLDLIQKLLPDIILLDIVMPKLNGLEIIQIIKQNKKFSHISIIAVTGLAKLKDRDKIMATGCDDYLCKPYLIEHLESKIHSHLKYRLT